MKRTFLETLHLKKGMSDSHHNGNLRIFFLLIRKITTLFLINKEDYNTFSDQYGRLRHFLWKITTLFLINMEDYDTFLINMEDYDTFLINMEDYDTFYGRLRHFF